MLDHAGLYRRHRRRRSETREMLPAVLITLFEHYFDLQTRRCAIPGVLVRNGFLVCPSINNIRKMILAQPWFRGAKVSRDRVKSILHDLENCGYVSISKQQHEQLDDGTWRFSPRLVTFKKKFFLELGGEKLWSKLLKAGSTKIEQTYKRIRRRIPWLFKGLIAPRDAVNHYLNPSTMYSPAQLHYLFRGLGLDPPPSKLELHPHFADLT